MNGYIESQVSFIQSGNRSDFKNLKITKLMKFRTFDCDVVWQTFDDKGQYLGAERAQESSFGLQKEMK